MGEVVGHRGYTDTLCFLLRSTVNLKLWYKIVCLKMESQKYPLTLRDGGKRGKRNKGQWGQTENKWKITGFNLNTFITTLNAVRLHASGPE